MPNTYTFDEVVERMAIAMREMEGKELAVLANQEFGMGLIYEGDSVFSEIGDE